MQATRASFPGPCHRLCSLLLVAFLASCGGGGGGGGDDGTTPPGGSLPATATFQLLPARLGLTVAGAGKLLALSAPGTLSWSSSDAAIASVDAEGKVSAVAAGNAVISAASGTTTASAAVKVVAADAASSSALIDAALAQSRISAEQALTYRVFLLFGDARLPAEFGGGPDGVPDHALLRTVSAKLSTLSPATQDLLAPFLVPPIYAESWFAKRTGLAPAGAASRAVKGERRLGATSVNCEAVALPAFWKRLSTAHFNVFYLALGDPFYDTYHRSGAEMIASVAEEVYAAETGLLQRFPKADTAEACNGGDGAVDIYLTAGIATGGLTTAYPGRCNDVPSFIAIDAGGGAIQAVVPQPAEARREVKAILAHEFAHVLQFAMDRLGTASQCDDFEWLDEATAQWFMDFVDPTWNREDGVDKASPNYRRSGVNFAQYLYSDHMASIEKPGLAGNPRANGYADYIFFQYLARKYDAQTIKQIYDATLTTTSVEAIESALAAKGGMKTVWPEFALSLWNDASNQNLDDLSRWDGYDFGLAPVFERRAGIPPAHPEAARLKTLAVEHQGASRATFKMLDRALDRASGAPAADHYEIQPRSIFYEHLKFSDPTVSSVYFVNPLGVYPNSGVIKVQARKKIDGVWKATEDWTLEPFKQFCLDKKTERLEELLVIVSNSEVNRGFETPFRFPKFFPMRTSVSNVGCWKWQGTASSVATSTLFGPSESRASGSATLEVAALLPGRIRFETTAGLVSGRSVVTLGACVTTSVGAARAARQRPMPDGTIDLNLDLDLGFGDIGAEPPDRKLVTLSGSASLATASAFVCPTVTLNSAFDTSWDWLHTDDPSLYQVSTDGRAITGSFRSVSPAGVTIESNWNFRALRE